MKFLAAHYFTTLITAPGYVRGGLIAGFLFLSLLVFRKLRRKRCSSKAKYINKKGYAVLTAFDELEHRHIAKHILGRRLRGDEVVHHINGCRDENQLGNLCVMNREKHEHFHSWLRWKKEKAGKYPPIREQKKILVQEYGGTLLENYKPPVGAVS